MDIFQKQYPTYQFDTKDYGALYFDELKHFLDDSAGVFLYSTSNRYNRLAIVKDKFPCKYSFKESTTKYCQRDKFNREGEYGEAYTQIIIGRFPDTADCFYNCDDGYFIMATNPWSFFKNDMFIQHILDKPKFFINVNVSTWLNPIFPIRCVISEQNQIPKHHLDVIKDASGWYSIHDNPEDPYNIKTETMSAPIYKRFRHYPHLLSYKIPHYLLVVSSVENYVSCIIRTYISM